MKTEEDSRQLMICMLHGTSVRYCVLRIIVIPDSRQLMIRMLHGTSVRYCVLGIIVIPIQYLVHCCAEHRAETSSGGFRDHCDS